jgi:hypothetical protein
VYHPARKPTPSTSSVHNMKGLYTKTVLCGSLLWVTESRSCNNCYRYRTRESIPVVLDGKRTALSQVKDSCWKSHEMDGCSEHFFERPTRFERIMKDESDDA